MKKSLMLAFLIAAPLAAVSHAQQPASAAPKQNVASSYRVWVKPGHNEAFKTAFAAHVQKFHSGTWRWRVYQVLSGPDEGAYHVLEGPASWTANDDRGDLGPDHMKDYLTNVQPHIEKSSPAEFLTYAEGLSTVTATNWSNKVLVTRITVNPGYYADVINDTKKWKAVWAKLDLNVAVWELAFSGENTVVIAGRLKNGLKDLDQEDLHFRKTFEEIHGANEYVRYLEGIRKSRKLVTHEILDYKPELSVK